MAHPTASACFPLTYRTPLPLQARSPRSYLLLLPLPDHVSLSSRLHCDLHLPDGGRIGSCQSDAGRIYGPQQVLAFSSGYTLTAMDRAQYEAP